MNRQPELREQCAGRWPSILSALGVPNDVTTGKNRPCPMPDCTGGSDRFRYLDKGNGHWLCNACSPPEEGSDGVIFLQRLNGWDFATAAREIRAVLGETRVEAPKSDDTEKRRADIARVWSEARPLAALDPVHRYLATTRGLRGIRFGSLTNIRHHPALPYWHDGECTTHPAMVVMAMTAEGKCGTLHRTYLTPTGEKANVPIVRKHMPSVADWKGGAVRLGEFRAGGTLVVGEGVETTLAYALRRRDAIPWAALDAMHLAEFVAPEGAKVIVAADNDESYVGQWAAHTLAKRLHASGHQVHVATPPDIGSDWADLVPRDRAGRAVS